MTEGTCSVEGCEKPIKRKSLCYGHYMKEWRYGTPTPNHPSRLTDLTGQTFGSLTPTRYLGNSKWECRCDCGEMTSALIGDLNRGAAVTCGNRATHYRKATSYQIVHDRLRRDRGPASAHRCTDCGEPAAHWSYDHEDPRALSEIVGKTVAPYSLDQSHYQPRCVPCHKRFDLDRSVL